MKSKVESKPEPKKRTDPAPDAVPSTGAGAGMPLFLGGPVPAGSLAFEQEADGVADRAAAGESNRRPASASDDGAPLEPHIRHAVEPILGANMGHVRIHGGPQAAAWSTAAGARAFTHGRDIYLGPQESAGDTRLLAHETTHVWQQGRVPAAAALGIQRQPQNAAPQTPSGPLNDATVKPWTDQQLGAEEDKLLGQLQKVAPEARAPLEADLGVVQHALTQRGKAVKPYWGVRLATKPEDQATPAQIAALQTRVDLLVALLQTNFPSQSADAIKRLQDERAKLETLHKDDVLREGDRLESAREAEETVGQVSRGLPKAAPDGMEAPFADVQKAISRTIGNLASPLQPGLVQDLKGSAEKYLDAFSQSIIRKTQDLQTKLASAPKSFDDSNAFINGYARDGRIALGGSMQEVGNYQFRLEQTQDALKGMGDLNKLAGGPFADRIKFLDARGASLDNTLMRGQALLVMAAGFQSGMILMQAVTDASDQVVWTDIALARGVRESVIIPLSGALDVPNAGVIEKAQASLLSKQDEVKKRVTDVQEYLDKVGTFIQIAAVVLSMYGGMAAMEAAGGSGVTTTALGAQQIAVGQFIRGSLAFTMGSQAVMMGLTGKVPTPEAFAKQALMDMATMSLAHTVTAGLGAAYGGLQNVPAGIQASAQFGALWAWSSINALMAKPSASTVSTTQTIIEAGRETAVGLLAGGVAHKIGAVPKLTVPPAATPEITAKQTAAMAHYEALRARGLEIQKSYEAWAAKEQMPAELERIMLESEAWYGSLRESLKGLADAGVIDPAQQAALSAAYQQDVAGIRTVRDMSRLGLRETGESTVGYAGDVRNMDAFLGRLVHDKAIQSYEPVGRGGMYKVVAVDGKVSFYYPEGQTPESARNMNLGADALAEKFPALPKDVRAKAAAALAALPPGDATRVALELSSTGGEAVLRWIADLGGKPRFMDAQTMLDCANNPSQLARLKAVPIADLEAWHQTPFEKAMGNRGTDAFLDFLDEVRSRRGTLSVKNAGEAAAITQEIVSAAKADEIAPEYTGPSMQAPGDEPRADRPSTSKWMEQKKKAGYGGTFYEVNVGGVTRLLQTNNGAILRAWTWQDGNAVNQIDVAATIKSLRDGLARAESIKDPAQKKAAVDALRPLADQLTFLRQTRVEGLADVFSLIDQVRPPLRPDAQVPAPDAPPAAEPEAVPVTTREVIVRRHSTLLERAKNQGKIDDPLIGGILSEWNPRTGAKAPTNPMAALDMIEKQLNAARDAAVKQYKKRFGAADIERLQKEAFGGRADFGDYLASLKGSQGLDLQALRGFGYMTQEPPSGEPPIDVQKVLARARTAAERNMVMQQFARIMESRPGGIPGAYRLLADMTSGKNSWRGGAWTLKSLALNTHIKLEDVSAFEQTQTEKIDVAGTESDVIRRYDVVLKSGQKIELKSWTRWFPDSIRSQFRRDVILQTGKLTDIEGISNMRWLFEGPPGITEMVDGKPRFRRMSDSVARQEIQKQMELGLEDAMNELSIPDSQKAAIRSRFQRLAPDLILIDAAPEGVD
jgi:hypothetical protein